MIQVGLFLLLFIVALTQVPGSNGLARVALTKVPVSNGVACPDIVRAVVGFDATKFMGTWYEVQKFFPILGNARKCVAAIYTPSIDDSMNIVLERVDEVTHKPKQLEGLITKVGSTKVANLMVKIPMRAPQLYKILDIDYENYFVAFSCYDRLSDVWIFARKRVLEDSYLQKAYAALAKYPTLKPTLFKATNQTDCPNTD